MTNTLRNWHPAILAALAAVAPSFAETAAPNLESYAKMPLAFERNEGQADSRVSFMAHGIAYSVFLTQQEAVLELSGPAGQSNVLRMGLAAANPRPRIAGLEQLPGQSNYLIGNDRTKWHTGVPTFGRVRYAGVYPGIDLVYYGNRGQLEYDFVAAPGADPSAIRMRFTGARRMHVAPDGDLVLAAGSEEIRFQKPSVYQTAGDGRRTEVSGRFVLRGADQAGFQLAAYDHSRALVIDPAIVRSTYLGGKGKDIGYSIAVDGQGSVYVAGETNSAAGFPLVSCFDCALSGPTDAFVTKFFANGTGYFYSTYLGGQSSDAGFGIAADAKGNAYVTGETNSPNFPLAGPALPPGGGAWDAFVTALNPAGGLIYSTYLGGKGSDIGHGIAVDSAGNAYVTGSTNSPNFPVASCLFCAPLGGTDVFVASFTGAGVLRFSTYFGGAGNDIGYGISVDANDEIGITGSTNSKNFPVVACAQCILHGGLDAFASALIFSPPTLALKWSTYWGGAENEAGYGIVMDSIGNAWITGYTDSDNFPVTANCVQCVSGGGQDAIVVRFNVNTAAFSDYLGGAGTDAGRGIVEGQPAAGGPVAAYLTGDTTSPNFPLVNCIAGFGCAPQGGDDAFVAEYTLGGGPIRVFSTYLGGKMNDVGRGIALGPYGEYVTGSTASNPFPIVGPCTQCTYRGGATDAFVTVIK
jgi:Beta-propeller repeat